MSAIANEQRTVEEYLAELPEKRRWAETIFSRISRIAPLPQKARVLDVGAAGGGFAVACAQLGMDCVGLEPWAAARENAARVAERAGVRFAMLDGSAEKIPAADRTFDVVHASSVIEHVARLDEAIAEVRRVLKPGGVFWFNAASAMCPVQDEIRAFPLFGWYPDKAKRAIMGWVKDAHPELVAFSRTPAVNWFTPTRARNLLARHGFNTVYDRWDLRGTDEGGAIYRMMLSLIRTSRGVRTLADVAITGCSYAAI